MDAIKSAYVNALLADAAYVSLVDKDGVLLPESTIRANRSNGARSCLLPS